MKKIIDVAEASLDDFTYLSLLEKVIKESGFDSEELEWSFEVPHNDCGNPEKNRIRVVLYK